MANRGKVVYNEPYPRGSKGDIYASDIRNLCNIMLINLNERNGINTIQSNPSTGYPTKLPRLPGVDTAQAAEINAIIAEVNTGVTITANQLNVLIKYNNALVSTIGVTAQKLQEITCTYPYAATIIHTVAETTVPDQQAVDPITGVGLTNADGTAKMVAGFKNPIPVLDASGNPTYYTVTGKEIFKEGPIVNIDETKDVNLCGNISISCPNRVTLYNWRDASSATDVGYVSVCSNVIRQAVVDVPRSLDAIDIVYVHAGVTIIDNTLIDLMCTNLRRISTALDGYNGWWANDLCARSCQVACQRSCELACQSCFGGTCHNQNCGGFS